MASIGSVTAVTITNTIQGTFSSVAVQSASDVIASNPSSSAEGTVTFITSTIQSTFSSMAVPSASDIIASNPSSSAEGTVTFTNTVQSTFSSVAVLSASDIVASTPSSSAEGTATSIFASIISVPTYYANDSGPRRQGLDGGAIAGIVVGIVAFFGVLGLFLWFIRNRRKGKQAPKVEEARVVESQKVMPLDQKTIDSVDTVETEKDKAHLQHPKEMAPVSPPLEDQMHRFLARFETKAGVDQTKSNRT